MTRRTVGAAVGFAALAGIGAPAVTAVGPVRRRLAPRLAGLGPGPHIALTFDDGPDPDSTPPFLDLLGRFERNATFFVLGSQVAAGTGLLARMVEEGHEVGVHGWTHRCAASTPPGELTRRLRDAKHAVEDVTGTAVTWYRPPYGVLSGQAFVACRTLGLTPVLWTAWGRDWERSATPARVVATVLRTLRPGGTILLHDTDRHARGDWHAAYHATADLLSGALRCKVVGRLRDHWLTAPCQDRPT